MLTTPFFAGLGAAIWSKFFAKHNTSVSLMYLIGVFVAVWLLMLLSSPKTRVQEEQKNLDGFSVTGSGVP